MESENSRTVKVEFNEQSKQVTASVKVEDTSPNANPKDVLEESKKLFEEAFEFSQSKTMDKMS